jgi:exonuclease III
VKIATFNINNINKRLANLLRWLEREKPEVVCLQELKTEHNGFPVDALRSTGYEAVWWVSAPGTVLPPAREQLPILTRSEPSGDDHDGQARYVEAAVRGILIASILSTQRQPSTRAEIHSQIGVVRTADRTCERPDHHRYPRRIGGRLQLGAESARHLPDYDR